jgi:type IV pilus assembly protein PilM
MSVVAVDFDPYRDWLKIADESRPLSPYQLLRVTPLESDLARIRAAYQRQVETLETKTQLQDSDLASSLFEELRGAFDLLSDAERKAVLDGQIRRQSQAAVPQPSAEAAAAVAGGVTCRACHKPNAPNRRFCGDCGQPLWEKCPQCSAECAVHERFCGVCGANIRGELDGKQRQYREQFAAAEQAAAEYQFELAISRFRRLAAVEDNRFEALAREALAAIERVERQRSDLQDQAAAVLARGQALLAEHSYEQAVTLLSGVHPSLRSPTFTRLIEQGAAARQELQELSSQIRQAMESKQYTGLLFKVERLLALKPGQAQAVGLAAQLREHFFKLAKTKVNSGRYEEAQRALEQVPESQRTPELNTLLDSASELAALWHSLQSEALADDSLRGLADKLAKFVPQNEEVAKLRQRLANRLTKTPSSPRLGHPDWQPVPVRTALGAPVDLLAYFTRLRGDEQAHAVLQAHPGEFYVALGLALQGVDLAEIPLNLQTAEKGNVLTRLKSVFARKSPAISWGVDVGDRALKALQLVRDEKTGDVKIGAAEYLELDTLIAGLDADMIRGEVQEKALAEFARRHELTPVKGKPPTKPCQIVAAIPSQRVLGRFFALPPMPAKKIEQAVQFEAKHQFPVALDELKWAYDVLHEAEGKQADEAPRQVMLVAARAAHVQDRVNLFKRAGIEVNVLQSECVALHNAIRYEFAADAAENGQPAGALALVDVGVSSTKVVLSSERGLWFRTFGQAGYNVTSQLVKQLQLTQDQAELVKRSPARAKRYYQLLAALQPVVMSLAGEIDRSLASFQAQNDDVPIRRVYGLGGGFRTHGLLRQLRYGK